MMADGASNAHTVYPLGSFRHVGEGIACRGTACVAPAGLATLMRMDRRRLESGESCLEWGRSWASTARLAGLMMLLSVNRRVAAAAG